MVIVPKPLGELLQCSGINICLAIPALQYDYIFKYSHFAEVYQAEYIQAVSRILKLRPAVYDLRIQARYRT